MTIINWHMSNVEHSSDHIHLSPGHLWMNWAPWNTPADLGGVDLTSAPGAVVVQGPPVGKVNAFYRGPNNHLWISQRPDKPGGQWWSAPFDLGGVALTSDPTAARLGRHWIDVFYRGPNNHLWTSWWPSGKWPGVLTNYYDNARTGMYPEQMLKPTNVNVQQFGKLVSKTIDGLSHAQPLYYQGLNTLTGIHNAAFVVTENNTVYAFDVADPNPTTVIWKATLGPSIAPGGCGADKFGQGITSTPVIDRSTKTMYVVAKTFDPITTDVHQLLHALDLETGKEKFNGPIEIGATVPGTGAGAGYPPNSKLNCWEPRSASTVAFFPEMQLNRAGLLLRNGVVYIAFGQICDAGCMHGWLFAYDAKTLKQLSVLNTTPDGGDGYAGAIWQSGRGLAADNSGVYIATGNGHTPPPFGFSLNTGGRNMADTFLRLELTGQGFKVLDWFTPCNQEELAKNDWDLSSSGPVVIPGTSLLLGSGKQGIFYLMDKSNMGHYHAPGASLVVHDGQQFTCQGQPTLPNSSCKNPQIKQEFKATNAHIHGSPVTWKPALHDRWIYVWSEEDAVKAFTLDKNGVINTTPIMGAPFGPPGMPGGIVSISADGSAPNTGIVWATHPNVQSCTDQGGNAIGDGEFILPGILRAYDASDITKELWNSKMNAPRDDLGYFAKFSPPTIADGQVFVISSPPAAGALGYLHVYGLLPK